MLVVIEPVDRTGPRGDRDPQRHPYNDYWIHILKSDSDLPDTNTVVHKVNGFDNWHTTILPEREIKEEATAYAKKLAKRLGCRVIWSNQMPKPTKERKTIRAIVECVVPANIPEKALVLALGRILEHPIQLGFKGNKDTLVRPKFKSYSRHKSKIS